MNPSGYAGARSLRQLLDAILVIGSDLDLSSVLRRIVESAVALVDARYGALGVLDESESRLAEFITVGVDADTHSAIGSLPKGLGILGSLIANAEPLRLAELADHPDRAGFPVAHPPMRSFMGVPIRVRGEVFGNLYLTDKTTGDTFTDVDEELVVGLASAAGLAIANARLYEQGRRRESALAGMHEIATLSLGGSAEEEILGMVARCCRRLVDADVSTVALPADGEEHGETLVIAAADGAGAAAMVGHRFRRAGSLSGQVVDSGRAVAVEDMASDSRAQRSLVLPGDLGPALLVPLWSGGRPLGTLCTARTRGREPFASAQQELAESFASQVSLVIERERARRRLERLVVLEDEERIARDLHHGVIQRAFAIGLSLQGALPLVADPVAKLRVESAIDEIDEMVRHIRSVVFDMVAPSTPPPGLRAAVLEVAARAAPLLGFDPRVVFSGPDANPGGEAARELVAALSEAVAHLARRPSATEVEVRVAAGDRAVLRISENGGILAEAEAEGRLDAIHARARTRGGTSSLQPGPGSGTVLEWSVPAGP